MLSSSVAVIGGGPAGLMAAEILAQAGLRVDLYDAMPSVGRKFLLAGRGGLNLTHSEAPALFATRYGPRSAQVSEWLECFDAAALRRWAHGLGIDTFVGSSGRVFPSGMKAAPLLRAWLHRLRTSGVTLHARHRWLGWDEGGAMLLDTPRGGLALNADAVVLALGGGSWARLGSDGAWQSPMRGKGVKLAPLLPSNCGFTAQWSPYFAERCAGQPLKGIAMAPADGVMRRGEAMITKDGLEGGLLYAWSAELRDAVVRDGSARVYVDLLPERESAAVLDEVGRPRGARSWSSHLGGRLGLRGAKLGLLRECLPKEQFSDPAAVASAIKRLPVTLTGIRPMDEAISTAGGVQLEELDRNLMIRALPGVFCAGEMLDWEAPTGGYLLTACFASGVAAGRGVLRWLDGGQGGRG